MAAALERTGDLGEQRSGNSHGIVLRLQPGPTGQWSMNKIYAGIHWSKRKRDAELWHMLVRSALGKAGIQKEVMHRPVTVTIRWNDRLDIDNHGYMAKLIIDGLKGWVIDDDTRRHVHRLVQEFWDKEGIEVTIE